MFTRLGLAALLTTIGATLAHSQRHDPFTAVVAAEEVRLRWQCPGTAVSVRANDPDDVGRVCSAVAVSARILGACNIRLRGAVDVDVTDSVYYRASSLNRVGCPLLV